MKLRIHADSLRLRLSQSEVAEIAHAGKLEDSISFSGGQRLIYALEAAEIPSMEAKFVDGRMHISIPAETMRKWASSDEVGIEGATPTLRVLIEKDFQCLHTEGERDTDAFPNPLSDTLVK